MKNYNEIYEGILDRLAKKAAGAIRKGGEKVAGGIEKGASGAERRAAGAVAKAKDTAGRVKDAAGRAKRAAAKGTIEKTPFGFVNKAKRAIKKLNKEFEVIVKDSAEQEQYLKKLAGKIGILKDKIADRYQDNEADQDMQNLFADIETFQKNANAIASAVKATKTRASNLTGIKENTESYEEADFDLFCEEWDRIIEDLDSCE